jgi:hypothetical protein
LTVAHDPAADPEASWADKHRGAMLRNPDDRCDLLHRLLVIINKIDDRAVLGRERAQALAMVRQRDAAPDLEQPDASV